MKLREAAQQALETLERLQVTPDPDLLDGHKWPIRWLDNSVTVTLTPPLLKSRGRATKLRAIQMSLGYQHGAAIATLRAALAEDALERMSERTLGIQMQPSEPMAHVSYLKSDDETYGWNGNDTA